MTEQDILNLKAGSYVRYKNSGYVTDDYLLFISPESAYFVEQYYEEEDPTHIESEEYTEIYKLRRASLIKEEWVGKI